MEPEIQPNTHGEPASKAATPVAENGGTISQSESSAVFSASQEASFIQQVFIGDQGLRAGWSIIIFLVLMYMIGGAAGYVISLLQVGPTSARFSVRAVFIEEIVELIGLCGAAWIVALIEHRHVFDFNLNGPRRTFNFLSGVAAGFLALSALVGALWSGGWLHFGSVSLSGAAIAKYAALWGMAFLLVGFIEEGLFRCYLQFTLTRALNFWWAIGILAVACVVLVSRAKGSAAWGVYAIVLLGLIPCLVLQLKRAPNSGFWQAAWVTSSLFGFIHLSNHGENWIGIFAAATVGFVFCVSVWLTGSAWWAIGCHASWDWGETYFYGTADSGMVAPGHYLSTSPSGNAFWSGGTDGPEGSILVLGVMLLLLLALLLMYRRRQITPAGSQ